MAAAAQSLLLAGTADCVSQAIHGPVELGHVAAMALAASVLSGACNAVWLRTLEEAWPGTGTSAVLRKSLADYLVCAPIVLSGYLVLVPLLTRLFGGGASLDAVGTSLSSASFGWTHEGFQSAMLLNLCTFQPYNLLQFSCVPPSLRPLGGACVSAASTVLLSAITLGYTVGDLVGGGGAAELDFSVLDTVAGYYPLDLSVQLDLATSVPGIILS
jgi:hypothetical protein